MLEISIKLKPPQTSVWDAEYYELILDTDRVNGQNSLLCKGDSWLVG
jgi:hypothetical protein